MIERQFLIGLITNTSFIQRINGYWTVKLIESATCKRIASWVMEYYEKYQKAPFTDIEGILREKIKSGLPKNVAEEIEDDILPGLSKEYENESLNVDYLTDQCKKYFIERHLDIHAKEIQGLLEQNKIEEAELKAANFKPFVINAGSWIDFSDEKILTIIDSAFDNVADPLITFPGPIGELLNDQLIRGAFVAFMSIREKVGKTYFLLELALRAVKQKRNVAFFSAGDMTSTELAMRVSIYLTHKSNRKKYCGENYFPVKDCVLNQLNKCKKTERSCYFGCFEKSNEKYLRQEVTINEFLEALDDYPEYTPCTNCEEYKSSNWGIPWYKKVNIGEPLNKEEAKKAVEEFFIKTKRKFKISEHPSGTFTVKQAETILSIWEKEENFIPEVIIFDYPDIMTDETVKEFRHMQNKIWMDCRGLSQKKKALVIIVTQGDSDAYERDLLTMKNFSEDKRKYAHPTAYFGINQDKKEREKGLKLMRINTLVQREGDFNSYHQVYVLQNLSQGRPFLGSFW